MPNSSVPDIFAEFSFCNERGCPEPIAFANPTRIVLADRLSDVAAALQAVEQAVNDGAYAAGYVAYEAAAAFDPALVTRADCAVPLVLFGIFESPMSSPFPQNWGQWGQSQESPGQYSVSDWTSTVSRERYAADVQAIRAAIARGDVYQVNYAMHFSAAFAGDDYAYYRRLRDAQGPGYSAYLNFGRYRILSASPELFFRRDGDRIVTCPMKGTIARGLWPEQDRERKAALAASEKDRAENVMIVDLLRNDLGRLAVPGTVTVDKLFQIEAFRTLYQMTSQISATAPSDTSLYDIFHALFPCGSITGAPKISAAKLITALEGVPRDAYCGAIGYMAPNRKACFNVAIRTVLVDTELGTADYGTGGGITWDSSPDSEYAEALAKSAVLSEEWPEFGLLETLCLKDGAYLLLDRHMTRLRESAEYFGIPVDITAARQALNEYATGFGSKTMRVRLVVSLNVEPTVEGRELANTPTPALVALAQSPIDSANRFLYHKTTHRAIYEKHSREHAGVFDVLLWNERRELTEFTIGNLVVELDGERWTPPIECGLLPGTMRAELLETGEIKERVLTLSDLDRASQIWLINSVRGWVKLTVE